MTTQTFHGTTIVCVRRGGKVALGGDGQVTLGNQVMKGNARKVRRLHDGKVLAGFAGGTADAFTLFEYFEAKLDKHGNLTRAAIELAKDWRTDRMLRRLEALLIVADKTQSFLISGTGDVIEPEHDLLAIGSGGAYAQAAAARAASTTPSSTRARSSRRRSRSRPTSASTRIARSRSKSCDPMSMTPREIVEELDKHIIGQNEAKRAVAIALRNRWRRAQIEEPLRSEITPKNILMIGPTGVGKTEIARRLAKLANAPFIKVEATKFTEVGYVGRDVDSIVRDLVDMAVKMTREDAMARVADRALDAAEDRLLDALLPGTGAPRAAASALRRRRRARRARLGQRRAPRHAPALPQDAARRRARRPRGGARGAGVARRRRDHGAARHGGHDEPAPEHVPEPVAGPVAAAQAQGEGRGRAAQGRGSRRSSSIKRT